jgi:hypothetical protein
MQSQGATTEPTQGCCQPLESEALQSTQTVSNLRGDRSQHIVSEDARQLGSRKKQSAILKNKNVNNVHSSMHDTDKIMRRTDNLRES